MVPGKLGGFVALIGPGRLWPSRWGEGLPWHQGVVPAQSTPVNKSSPLELALHAALDARGPPSRRSRLPSGAGSANTGQSMVKIVSKHHRVLDAANELMWTWLAEEARGSGTDSSGKSQVYCQEHQMQAEPSCVVQTEMFQSLQHILDAVCLSA